MGFLRKLFGLKPTNPTEEFPKRLVPPRLAWDHTARTFCGIPLPAPVEALAPLGPAEGFRVLGENYWILTYPDLGLELELNRGQLQHFTLWLADNPDDPRPGLSFARPILDPAGKALTPETTPADLDSLLGAGETMSQDEEETIRLHRSGHACLEAAFAPDGKLMRIEIYNDHE